MSSILYIMADSDSEVVCECELCGNEREDMQVGSCLVCHDVESMCDRCAIWDETTEQWYCPFCAEKNGLLSEEAE